MWNEKLLVRPPYSGIFTQQIPFLTIKEVAPVLRSIQYLRLKDMVIFDIGANQGLWSAAMILAAAPKIGRIHMFEPLPGNRDKIEEHMRNGLYAGYSDRLKLNPIGLSESKGTTTIHFETDASVLASIDSDHCEFPYRTIELDKSMEIDIDTVDNYVAENNIAEIDVLKIDVEGHELSVLRGAQGSLAANKIRSCLFEFGPHQLSRREIFKDFYEFFADNGMGMFEVTMPRGDIKPIMKYQVAFEHFDKVTMFLACRLGG